jgi:hypothetical protein
MASEDYVDKFRREYTNPTDKAIKRQDNKYGVKIKQYPSDLQTADNLKHYVLFNINVRGKSSIDKSKRLFEVRRDPNSANLSRDQLAGPGIRGVTAVSAGAAAGVAVSSLVKGAAKAFGKSGAGVAIAGNTAGLIAGGAVAGAVSTVDLLKKDTTFRISDAIALYVDGPPTVKYSMNYANKELGTLLGVLSGSVLDSQSALKAAGEVGAALGATLAKLPGAFGAADIASALSASSATSLNPFKEVVFESVDFRSFAFKYKFFPKNKKESEDVFNIISLFKEHMHPELSSGKMFFIYPSEFQITYYYGSDENTYFHRFRPCALESMDVTYGGDQFSSFKDGAPTEINMSLTFRELEILTKNMVREGY